MVRAQGSVEYLMLVAVVIVIGLVFAVFSLNFVSVSGDVSSNSVNASQKIGSSGISVVESVVDLDNDGIIVLKNATAGTIQITKVSLGGADTNFSSNLGPGQESSFYLNNIGSSCSCSSGETEKICDAVVSYVSRDGLVKSSVLKIVVNCSSENVALGSSVQPLDSVSPSITLSAPLQGSVDTNRFVSFSYSVSDNNGVASCSLLVDGVVVDTDNSSSGSFVYEFLGESAWSDHNWSISCIDYSNNVSTSSEVSFSVNDFGGGTGVQEDPYEIYTCLQLQGMNSDLDANYELAQDINCYDTKNWNNGNGFSQIGNVLLSASCSNARCSDQETCVLPLGCDSDWVDVEEGCNLGDAPDVEICSLDSYPCENICSGTWDYDNFVCTDYSETYCSSNTSSCSYCGYSWNSSFCVDSYCSEQASCERSFGCGSTWNVPYFFSGTLDGANYSINGLYLSSHSMFSSIGSSATIKNISMNDFNIYNLCQNFAGFVRTNYGVIENSSFDYSLLAECKYGLSSGSGSALVKTNEIGGVIRDLTVNLSDWNNQGLGAGVVQDNNGLIERVIVSGTMYGPSGSSSAKAPVVAYNKSLGSVVSCGSSANVYSGSGLVYENRGLVDKSWSSGNVFGESSWYNGGLVGLNYGTVRLSYSTGNVGAIPGKTPSLVGGLVGGNWPGAVITDCYATGDVNIPNSSAGRIGGLVGLNISGPTITRSYATGNVYSTGQYVGGLVGDNSGTVSDSFSTGSVVGGSTVGGLIGLMAWNAGTNRYWDTTLSGQANCYNGGNTNCTSTTNNEEWYYSSSNAPMSSWDFGNNWVVQENNYPILKWQTE